MKSFLPCVMCRALGQIDDLARDYPRDGALVSARARVAGPAIRSEFTTRCAAKTARVGSCAMSTCSPRCSRRGRGALRWLRHLAPRECDTLPHWVRHLAPRCRDSHPMTCEAPFLRAVHTSPHAYGHLISPAKTFQAATYLYYLPAGSRRLHNCCAAFRPEWWKRLFETQDMGSRTRGAQPGSCGYSTS